MLPLAPSLLNSTVVATYRSQLFSAWVLLTDAQEACNTTSNEFDIADVGREFLNTVRKLAILLSVGSPLLSFGLASLSIHGGRVCGWKLLQVEVGGLRSGGWSYGKGSAVPAVCIAVPYFR